jgi:prepilin-type N-terminal cleavage/methylation domain-containing protein
MPLLRSSSPPLRLRARAAGARRGFTLIEVMIVVAIMSVLTAIGFVIARDIIPQYRTRGAAMDFANWVSTCRTTAIQTGRQCRILLVDHDPDLVDLDDNLGSYLVQVEVAPIGGGTVTDAWDTMPIDTVTDTVDNEAATGTIDLSTGQTRQRRVAIDQWDAIGGPGVGNNNAIVFDSRGFVANPPGDFRDGKISVTFVNKVAESRSAPDRWTVNISRAGVAQLDSSRRTADDNFTMGGGTATSTTYDPAGAFSPP